MTRPTQSRTLAMEVHDHREPLIPTTSDSGAGLRGRVADFLPSLSPTLLPPHFRSLIYLSLSLSLSSPLTGSGVSWRKRKNVAARGHKEEAGGDVCTPRSKDLPFVLQDTGRGAREVELGVVVLRPD